jgi:hypothetical protein
MAPGSSIHHGVSLEAFALIRAGLADEIELAELLAYAAVDFEAWERGEPAWEARVIEALENEEHAFLEEVDRLSATARSQWERRIPPLDEDLAAWLGFVRAWGEADAPVAMLEKAQLRPADMVRLHHLWSERLGKSAALRADARAILSGPGMPVREPKPEPARLKRAPDPDRVLESTGEIVGARKHPLPFAAVEPSEAPEPAPSMFSALPRVPGRRKKPGIVETGELSQLPELMKAFPFITPPAATPPPPKSIDEAPDEDAPDPRGVFAASTGAAATPQPSFQVAPPSPAVHITRPRAGLPADALDRTGEILWGPRAPVVPFSAGPAPLDPKQDVPTSTAPLPPTPPVERRASAPPSGRRPPPLIDQTADIFANPAPALPFSNDKTGFEPRLTVEQHATLCAEIAHQPQRKDEIFARYKLSAEDKAAEDGYWHERMASDANARATWMSTLTKARDALKRGG